MFNLFDAHCDTIYQLTIRNEGLKENSLCVNTNSISKYKKTIQVFAMFSDPEKQSFLFANSMLSKFYEETQKENINIIKNREDILSNHRVKALLSIEGAEPLEGKSDRLDYFYNKGVRLITLTWNGVNEIGCGALSGNKKGLTSFGFHCVEKMNKLGMVIDVSHLNEKGFYDVIETTKKPIVASHSNSKKICDHKRNLTDLQFRELIHNDGVCGINIYPTFLSNSGEASVSTIIKHIEHFASLGGIDNIGIGSDFDGIDKLPLGIKNLGDLDEIFNSLLKLNYSEEQVKKISYDNFCRIFLKNLQKRLEKL